MDDSMADDDPQTKAREFALGILSKRLRSTAQLTEVLLDSGYDSPTIRSTLDYLARCGYLDDERLIQTTLERARRESRGSLWLDQCLQEQGLDSLGANEARASLAHEEVTIAKTALLGRYAQPLSHADARRAGQYLGRRGFGADTVETVVSQYVVSEN